MSMPPQILCRQVSSCFSLCSPFALSYPLYKSVSMFFLMPPLASLEAPSLEASSLEASSLEAPLPLCTYSSSPKLLHPLSPSVPDSSALGDLFCETFSARPFLRDLLFGLLFGTSSAPPLRGRYLFDLDFLALGFLASFCSADCSFCLRRARRSSICLLSAPMSSALRQ